MNDGMGSDGDFEYGRPRYQPAPGPAAGDPRRLGDGPDGHGRAGEEVGRTAPGAVLALVIAAVGWLVPIVGGVLAIRRANAALNVIDAAGGALDGASLAVWAKRLGWFSVVVWSALLFWWFGGALFQLVYRFLLK